MDKFIEQMLDNLGGDYGKALVKVYETTENGYKVTLDELKKLSKLLTVGTLNDTTLRGHCKVVSQKNAIVEKLIEALKLNKVSNTSVKQAIEKAKNYGNNLTEKAADELRKGDGREDVVISKIMDCMDDLYNAVEKIISSEIPAPTLLKEVEGIHEKLQLDLTNIMLNNQILVDAFNQMASLYIRDVEIQLNIIRTQDPTFMKREIEPKADELNEEWFPLENAISLKQKTDQNQEVLTTKVHQIFKRIKDIG